MSELLDRFCYWAYMRAMRYESRRKVAATGTAFANKDHEQIAQMEKWFRS